MKRLCLLALPIMLVLALRCSAMPGPPPPATSALPHPGLGPDPPAPATRLRFNENPGVAWRPESPNPCDPSHPATPPAPSDACRRASILILIQSEPVVNQAPKYITL